MNKYFGTGLAVAVIIAGNAVRAEEGAIGKVGEGAMVVAPKVEGVVDTEKYLKGYGWLLGNQAAQSTGMQFGFNEEEKKLFNEGVKMALDGKVSPIDLKKEGEGLQKFLGEKAKAQEAKLVKQMEDKAKKTKEGEKAFYDGLNANPAIKKTASGLYYEILNQGSDIKPTEHSVVTIDYVGTLISGSQFDSSIERGEPATFELGGVIAGFKEGLQLIGKGGKIKLYVPSELGYGSRDVPGIPAGSTLIFVVDMIDVKSGELPVGEGQKALPAPEKK